MKKFTSLKSIPAYLPIVNIDTDMIIPKQFLKTIKRTGLGKNLFHEMRYDDDGKNIDKELIEILYEPSQRKNSKEAFRGFINLFDDYLATDLFDKVNAPIQLIWGEKDPWESLNEAREWKKQFRNIKRLDIIDGAGHCPHDEEPEKTNKLIHEFIQETK